MQTTILYNYLGVNGSIQTPILLEGIYHTKSVRLVADQGKFLTRDNKNFYKIKVVPEVDLEFWKEVSNTQGSN